MERTNFWIAPYKAPSLPGALVLFLIIAFACFSFSRGADMAFGADASTVSPLVQDALFNKRFIWGWGLMGASTFLLLSLCLRIQGSVWVGHVLMLAIHTGLFSMYLPGILDLQGNGGAILLGPLGGMLWHGLFVYLSRPWARTRRERV